MFSIYLLCKNNPLRKANILQTALQGLNTMSGPTLARLGFFTIVAICFPCVYSYSIRSG